MKASLFKFWKASLLWFKRGTPMLWINNMYALLCNQSIAIPKCRVLYTASFVYGRRAAWMLSYLILLGCIWTSKKRDTHKLNSLLCQITEGLFTKICRLLYTASFTITMLWIFNNDAMYLNIYGYNNFPT